MSPTLQFLVALTPVLPAVLISWLLFVRGDGASIPRTAAIGALAGLCGVLVWPAGGMVVGLFYIHPQGAFLTFIVICVLCGSAMVAGLLGMLALHATAIGLGLALQRPPARKNPRSQ